MSESLRPNPDVVFQSLHGEVVLVHMKTNRIYALNRTGARLWELVAAGSSRDEIGAQLAREFDVERNVLDEEIETMLSSLVREGLII